METLSKNFNLLLKIVYILTIVLGLPNISLALTSADIPIPAQITGLEEQIDVNVTPSYPKPGDAINISLEAYGIDLDKAPIKWSIDGKVSKEGIGAKSFDLTAGKLGEQTVVTIEIQPPYSNIMVKTVTINPQSVDIIWEANTYTPPFYKGKAMFTPQEKAVFVAMPNITDSNGIQADPKTLTYKWSRDQEVLGSLSGYGQNSLLYTGNILMRPVETRVEIGGANASASGFMYVATKEPETYLYEKNPLYGILFNKEVSSSFAFGDKEERTLAVFPYFFGINSRNANNLKYKWTLNYNPIEVPENQSEMTFRNVDKLEGKSLVNVSLKNKTNFLQEGTTRTYIDFSKPKNAFAF
jgi:hypothetical protein